MTDIAVLGAGGHAGVIIQLLRASKRGVGGVFDDGKEAQQKGKMGFEVRPMSALPPGSAAVIAIGSNAVRHKVDARFPAANWVTAVHPSAVVDPTVTLGAGTVVMAGAVIQAGTRVGRHVVVNTRCSIDHDCVLGDYASVAPGATLCGTVTLGEGAWIGAGATIKEGLTVGSGCTLGAGATLVKNMSAENETWVGPPAALLKVRARRAHFIRGYYGWVAWLLLLAVVMEAARRMWS
jgi:acetyltransferase EpsM